MIPVFSARHCVLPLLSVVATGIPGHAGGWHLRRKPCVVRLPCLFPYLILRLLIYARSFRQLSTNFSYEDLDLSGPDQFTMWGKMSPEEILTEHVVDIHRIEADFRDAFERNQSSSSSQSYGVNKYFLFNHQSRRGSASTTGIQDPDAERKIPLRCKSQASGTSLHCRRHLSTSIMTFLLVGSK